MLPDRAAHQMRSRSGLKNFNRDHDRDRSDKKSSGNEAHPRRQGSPGDDRPIAIENKKTRSRSGLKIFNRDHDRDRKEKMSSGNDGRGLSRSRTREPISRTRGPWTVRRIPVQDRHKSTAYEIPEARALSRNERTGSPQAPVQVNPVLPAGMESSSSNRRGVSLWQRVAGKLPGSRP